METKIITQVASKFMMLTLNVGDMRKSKSFYTDKLGLKITTDYRIDDNNWWISLTLPDGGSTMTLARTVAFNDNATSGPVALYFATSDIDAAHKQISGEGFKVNDVKNDLFGPGSGVKFFNLEDPDGNLVHLVQTHEPRFPF